MKNLLPIFLIAFTYSLQSQDILKLKVEVVETTATEKVYNFITHNFVGFVGWQFQMEFDGTKMSYRETRNPLHPTQSTQNFHESEPGLLRSVWLDADLVSNDYPDSTVLFQLVFDLLAPEGSPLCFRESQEHFEFILDVEYNYELAEILISDDCYQGFSIFFETTSTAQDAVTADPLIKDVFLSTSGSLSFSSDLDQALSLSLLDVNGKVLTTLDSKEYGPGRHTVECNGVIPGVYLLQAIADDGREVVVKVSASE